MFMIYGLQEINTVTSSDIKKRARIGNIFFTSGYALGLEPIVLLKLHLTIRVFPGVFRAVDLLNNSKPLLLKDYTTGIVMVDERASNGVQNTFFTGHPPDDWF